MKLEDTVTNLHHNLFNIKYAAMSALANGVIAAAVNYEHGALELVQSGGTQSLASFLSTGVTARLVQHFSPIKNPYISYFFGSLTPAMLTFGISFFGHWINNTPELLQSCIAPTLISYGTSFITNHLTRQGYLLPKNYHSNFS